MATSLDLQVGCQFNANSWPAAFGCKQWLLEADGFPAPVVGSMLLVTACYVTLGMVPHLLPKIPVFPAEGCSVRTEVSPCGSIKGPLKDLMLHRLWNTQQSSLLCLSFFLGLCLSVFLLLVCLYHYLHFLSVMLLCPCILLGLFPFEIST